MQHTPSCSLAKLMDCQCGISLMQQLQAKQIACHAPLAPAESMVYMEKGAGVQPT